MRIEPIDSNDGLNDIAKDIESPKGIALIDADTVAYLTCLFMEQKEELLPEAFYTPKEWEELKQDPGFYEDDEGTFIFRTDLDLLVEVAEEKIEEIQRATNTESFELYFSSGITFRHKLTNTYKANRLHMRYPEGLDWLKRELADKYPGGMCDGFEADDMVVYLKRTNPKKYTLCAVDKDVINSVPGHHYNYYKSPQYNIEPKWVDIDATHATKWAYMQCLMGDSGDNIAGCPGIGKKRAATALEDAHLPCDMWKEVVKLYKKKGLTIKHAIETMRLVNMHQLKEKDGQYKIELWEPPC